MASQEFALIERFFNANSLQRDDVILGIGDDAAVVNVPAGQSLVVAVDTLVENVHFLPNTDPADIAYKTLAVNLSDLAAMGATPAWATLALTLPSYDEAWLQGFAQGFFSLANDYDVSLIGGDTTRGPLTLSVQLQGHVSADQMLTRRGARVGDLIYVSGCIGDAGLALLHCLGKLCLPESSSLEYLVQRLHRPTARVELGQALAGVATAAIDISDGLAADLGHILKASGVGAELDLSAIPRSSAYREAAAVLTDYLHAQAYACVSAHADIEFAVTAGDDYELCFTVPASQQQALADIEQRLGLNLTLIGEITEEAGLTILDDEGQRHTFAQQGYQHF